MDGQPLRYITLKAARVNSGMTQAEAAAKLKITPYSLAKYETYQRPTPLTIAWRMSAVYRVPIQCLDPGDDMTFF